jgi:hypothetical protein
MRTELGAALVAIALLGAAPARAEPVSPVQLGVSPEMTLVGLAYGLRPEVNYRLGGPGTASRLRASVGALIGPDSFYLPVSIGYRALYRESQTLRPLLGAGLELQNRIVSDAPAASSLALYLEGGLMVALGERLSAGAVAGADVTLVGGLGAGLSIKACLGWAL